MDAARRRPAGPQSVPHPALARRPRAAMSRRAALLAATLVVFAAGIVALIMRSQTDGVAGDASTTGAVDSAPNEPPVPPTSEALIAEALTAGDISYEESLLQRA